MRLWIAFWNIFKKDLKLYYLKPPNLSWGLLFPLAWTLLFFIKAGKGLGEIREFLPGVVSLAVLFGSSSMLAVTITFEKRTRAFERLLLAPLPFSLLTIAKLWAALFFGIVNAFMPIIIALFVSELSSVSWAYFFLSVFLIASSSSLLGFFIAVCVTEVFQAQTLSNFFRFPMIFLCGLFFPIWKLPLLLRPLSFALPLTYGNDALRAAFHQEHLFSPYLNFVVLIGVCVGLFAISLRVMKKRWIL